MAARRPLAMVSGLPQEVSTGDTLVGAAPTSLLAWSYPTITGTLNTAATAGTGMVVNSVTTDQSLVDLTVPAAQVAASDLLVFDAWGDARNSSGGTLNYTFKLKLGATTLLTTGSFGYTNSTDRFEWQAHAKFGMATTSDERWKGYILGGGVGSSSGGFVSVAFSYEAQGQATENLTSDKTLSLTVAISATTATADARLTGATLMRFR